MQIRKIYFNVKPDLLLNEVKDFAVKQGTTIGENKMETLALSNNSTNFITRGTLTFLTPNGKECMRAHLVGVAVGETKLMLDIDDTLFPNEKTQSFLDDIDFIFKSYEAKPK